MSNWTPKDFINERWYCAHCPLTPECSDGRHISQPAMLRHLGEYHDIEYAKAENGVDYYSGWQARQVHGRRCAEADTALSLVHFAFEQPDYNVDDFLIDCGDPEAA